MKWIIALVVTATAIIYAFWPSEQNKVNVSLSLPDIELSVPSVTAQPLATKAIAVQAAEAVVEVLPTQQPRELQLAHTQLQTIVFGFDHDAKDDAKTQRKQVQGWGKAVLRGLSPEYLTALFPTDLHNIARFYAQQSYGLTYRSDLKTIWTEQGYSPSTTAVQRKAMQFAFAERLRNLQIICSNLLCEAAGEITLSAAVAAQDRGQLITLWCANQSLRCVEQVNSAVEFVSNYYQGLEQQYTQQGVQCIVQAQDVNELNACWLRDNLDTVAFNQWQQLVQDCGANESGLLLSCQSMAYAKVSDEQQWFDYHVSFAINDSQAADLQWPQLNKVELVSNQQGILQYELLQRLQQAVARFNQSSAQGLQAAQLELKGCSKRKCEFTLANGGQAYWHDSQTDQLNVFPFDMFSYPGCVTTSFRAPEKIEFAEGQTRVESRLDLTLECELLKQSL